MLNHGTLRDALILGESLFNDGTISVGSTSFVRVGRNAASHENATFGDGGVLTIAMSANSNGGVLASPANSISRRRWTR